MAVSAPLVRSLVALLDAEPDLQRRILEAVAAHASSRLGDPRFAVPRWTHPEGLPPLPHAPSTAEYWPPSTGAPDVAHGSPPSLPVEVVLMFDVFAVAQLSPAACQALFLTSPATLGASAAAAVQAWLSRYTERCVGVRQPSQVPADSIVQPDPSTNAHRPVVQDRLHSWLWQVCAPMLHQQELEWHVHVVLLRVPSLYTAVTGGLPACVRPHAQGRHGSAHRETQPRVGGAVGSCAEPSDRFLDAAHTVRLVGVVHCVCFEGHSATAPAPWVTLLPLPVAHTGTGGSASAPLLRRRTVDLRRLPLAQRCAVAVLGCVVVVHGHAQVAQHRPTGSGRACSAGESALEEYLVATWAAPVGLRGVGCAAGDASPLLTAAAGFAGTPHLHRSPDGGVGGREDGGGGCSATPPSTPPLPPELDAVEEEAAARTALTCWEGTRLALGTASCGDEDSELGEGCGGASAAPAFSVSLDCHVAVQLALMSAQLASGVLVLVVDEATPESLVSRVVRGLQRVVPSAALEVPASVLPRAKPSFFLPSYRTVRVPAAPPTPSPCAPRSPSGSWVGPRGCPPRPRPRPGGGGTAVAAAPPCHHEVVLGGAITHASGRALVLQRVESLPVVTLRLLQEALRDDTDGGGAYVDVAAVQLAAAGAAAAPEPVQRRQCTDAAGMPQPLAAAAANGLARRCVVQREGGQAVRYCATHSALCSVRHGAALTSKSHLVDFAVRCDVVVRPAYDTRRQAAALQGTGTAPEFCALLRERAAAWLNLLGGALALPLPDAAGCAGVSDGAPVLTEACGRLLSTYFMAAKVLCREGADASMMTTLVKLTAAHTMWRTRLTAALVPPSCSHGARASSPSRPGPSTALIDAVAAVGLCDATLHFFTAKTLLGDCAFRLLEAEAWPVWASEEGVRFPSSPTQDGGELGDSDVYDWRHLCAETEHRTRLTVPRAPSTFSIVQLVQDLQDHLERGVLQAGLLAR